MAKRETVLRALTSLRQNTVVQFLFVLPFLFGLLAKLNRSKPWFGDYQAVACAGLKDQAHLPFYDLHMACPGMHASVFVYIPVVAHVTAWFEQVLSEPGLFWLYAGLFVVSLLALVIVPLKWAPGRLGDKLPFAVFLGSAAVTWGNIAVLMHGAVLAAALMFEAAPWLFVAVVALVAAVKPVFLTYLAVVLLARMSWTRRLVLAGTGAATGLAPTILFTFTDPGTAYQWAHLLKHFVYDVTPGSGFYGWIGFFGLRGDTPVAQAAYLLYAGAMMLSALTAADRLKLNSHERLWLGLSVAGLLIPRIMSQDVFLLAPGLVTVAQRAVAVAGAGPVTPLARVRDFLLRQGPYIVFSFCLLAFAFGFIQHSRYSNPLALLGLSLYLIGVGISAAFDARRSEAAERWQWRPWRGLPRRGVNTETQA